MSVESISNVTGTAASYAANAAQNAKATENADNKNTASKKEEGVVYEKSSSSSKGIYSRDDIVARLKSDAEARTAQMKSLVTQMMQSQGTKIGQANDMWRFLASGKFTVSADVKAQAQKDIAEDGYWGVEKTSDRIIEFAKALVGNDETQIEKMRAAFEKGFKQATGAWGSKLPDISHRTYDAVMKKFDQWAGKSVDEDTTKTQA